MMDPSAPHVQLASPQSSIMEGKENGRRLKIVAAASVA
jgi:hypothetical protein